jgi:transcriptional regulator with XRE-family HTH domain
MRDLELTLRVRNNRLKQRRLELGLSPRELAEQIGMNYQGYLDYEGLRASPLGPSGWKPTAVQIAEFHGVSPHELWPERILKIVCPTVTQTLDARDLHQLTGFPEVADPEQLLLERERTRVFDETLATIPARKQLILRRWSEGDTFTEIAKDLQRGKARVQTLAWSGLRTVRDHLEREQKRGNF